MKMLQAIAVLIVFGAAILAGFVWSGVYNVGADDPHWSTTKSLLTIVRNRSITVHSHAITVPDLDDPQLVAMGAGHYSEMCTQCHLAPGMENSELREGLYPKPPVLYKTAIKDPAREFWIIKHGIKMTAMPAWGTSHSDRAIWAMVAFLRKLPTLSAQQYRAMTVNTQDTD